MIKTQQRHGVPALCSLLLPGLGQMMKGQVGMGILCLFVVVLGYMFFVLPGIIFHVLVVVDAYRSPEEDGLMSIFWVFALFALALSSPALAQEEEKRVDLYDARSRRAGYAVVDPGTGRVDFYDKDSRRTGWGKVDERGRLERFGLDGRRAGEARKGR